MKIVAYRNAKPQQRKVLEAFAKSCGAQVENSEKLRPADLHVIMGFTHNCDNLVKECIDNKYNYVFIDHAYFDRGYANGNFRVTLNALHKHWMEDCPFDRLDKFKWYLKDWQKPGDTIIVIPPPPMIEKIYNLGWWKDVTRNAFLSCGHKVKIKYKNEGRLSEYLPNALAVVSYNSVAAVESAMNGVRTISDPLCPAYPISAPLGTSLSPDRKRWLASLSYGQFNITEIELGLAYKLVVEERRQLISGTRKLLGSQTSDKGLA